MARKTSLPVPGSAPEWTLDMCLVVLLRLHEVQPGVPAWQVSHIFKMLREAKLITERQKTRLQTSRRLTTLINQHTQRVRPGEPLQDHKANSSKWLLIVPGGLGRTAFSDCRLAITEAGLERAKQVARDAGAYSELMRKKTFHDVVWPIFRATTDAASRRP